MSQSIPPPTPVLATNCIRTARICLGISSKYFNVAAAGNHHVDCLMDYHTETGFFSLSRTTVLNQWVCLIRENDSKHACTEHLGLYYKKGCKEMVLNKTSWERLTVGIGHDGRLDEILYVRPILTTDILCDCCDIKDLVQPKLIKKVMQSVDDKNSLTQSSTSSKKKTKDKDRNKEKKWDTAWVESQRARSKKKNSNHNRNISGSSSDSDGSSEDEAVVLFDGRSKSRSARLRQKLLSEKSADAHGKAISEMRVKMRSYDKKLKKMMEHIDDLYDIYESEVKRPTKKRKKNSGASVTTKKSSSDEVEVMADSHGKQVADGDEIDGDGTDDYENDGNQTN